jgi:superoxide dismutase
MKNVSAAHFGGGWTWLLVLPAGGLAVTDTDKQDNPLMSVSFGV